MSTCGKSGSVTCRCHRVWDDRHSIGTSEPVWRGPKQGHDCVLGTNELTGEGLGMITRLDAIPSNGVVMCVPFGRSASRWQRPGRHNWAGMDELTFFVHLMVALW